MIAQLVAGAFQSHAQNFAVGAGGEFLDAVGVEVQQVFEHEHEVADGFHQRRVGFFDFVKDFFAGAGIEAIEHLRDGAHATIGFTAEFSEGEQLLADDAGDFGDDVGRDLVEIGHAECHIGTHFRRERSEQGRRLGGAQMRQDERDGLRVLAMDEFGELLGVGFVQDVETGDIFAQRFDQAVVNLASGLGAESAFEHLARIFKSTLHDVVIADHGLMKFFQNGLRLFRTDVLDVGDFAADELNFLLAQILDELGAALFAEDDEKDGGASHAGQGLRNDGGGAHRELPPGSSASQLRSTFEAAPLSFRTVSRTLRARTSTFLVVALGSLS